MTARPGRLSTAVVKGACAAAILLFVFAFPAKSQESSPFSTIDAAACAKLDDKNLQVGPPDEEIVASCEALRRSAIFSQSFQGGPAALVFAIFGMILAYAVYGVPIRAVTALISQSGPGSAVGAATRAVVALLLRGSVAIVILTLLSVPYAMAVGGVVIIAALALLRRPSHLDPVRKESEVPGPKASQITVDLADYVNDVVSSAPGILAITLLARRDLRLVALGLVFAVGASAPHFITMRRGVRRSQIGFLSAAAALGAAVGSIPEFANVLEDAALPGPLSAVIFAFAACGAVWIGRQR